MTTENLRSRRINVDPVLSTFSVGMNPAYGSQYIGNQLFPILLQDFDEAQIRKNGDEAFRIIDDAVGDKSRPEAIDTKLDKLKIEVDGHALMSPVSNRDQKVAAIGPFRYDLARRNLATVVANMLLRREYLQALLATDSTVYPVGNVVNLTAEKWDTVSGGVSTNDPIKRLLPYIERTIPRATGVRPNILWMGGAVWPEFMANTKVVSRIFGVNNPQGIVTQAAVAAALGVEKVLVGRAISKAEDGTVTDLWGKFAGLAYVAPAVGEDLPSFGYTVEQKVFGEASELVTRFEDPIMGPAGGWWIKRGAFYTPALTFNEAGTLFTNPVV